jgi:hypothetical protein
MTDRNVKLKTCLAGLTVAIATALSASSFAGALEDAFADGKASVDVRYRFETVDDSVNKDATAGTLRTRLGFTTSDKEDLSAHIDFEHITRASDPEYNSGKNNQTDYATVADPDATELNQAFLKYKFMDNLTGIAGRQRIILDNARFVGNVGWRQNEQTYDAFLLSAQPVKDLSIALVNVQRVNTISSDNIDVNANLLNAGYSAFPGGKLTGYGYLIEIDDTPDASTSTYGLRYKGDASNFLYTLEYATQSDYGDSSLDVSADYMFGELGYNFADTVKVFVAQETLSSDDGNVAFQTPLATKHAFNGWADQFLTTPANGLVDTYIKVTGKVLGTKLIAVYHDFSADEGSTDYGTEIDLVAVKQLNKTFKALVKYADYSTDASTIVPTVAHTADTQKVWVSLEMALKQ